MTFLTMYPAVPGSPTTFLSAPITAADLTVPVDTTAGILGGSATGILVFGPNLPNYEAVVITATDAGAKTFTAAARGFEGTAQAWPAGTIIGRFEIAYDPNAIQNNLTALINAPPQDSTGSIIFLYKNNEGL